MKIAYPLINRKNVQQATILQVCRWITCLGLITFSITTQATMSSTRLDLPSDVSVDYEEQRKIFIQAEKALNAKQPGKYKKLSSQLADYPLYPYLKYRELRRKVSSLDAGQIQDFMLKYGDTPYAGKLQKAWLSRKAEQKKWAQFLKAYTPQASTEMKCHYANALIQTDNKQAAFKQVPDLWLVGKSQPRSCDPVFKAFRNAGRLTPKITWRRIELAMTKGRTSLAGYLAKSLDKTEKKWVDEWIKVHKKPALIKNNALLKKSHPIRNTILVHALKRLARHQPEAAISLWQEISNKYSLPL